MAKSNYFFAPYQRDLTKIATFVTDILLQDSYRVIFLNIKNKY
jgi:hypothetical protein